MQTHNGDPLLLGTVSSKSFNHQQELPPFLVIWDFEGQHIQKILVFPKELGKCVLVLYVNITPQNVIWKLHEFPVVSIINFSRRYGSNPIMVVSGKSTDLTS